MATTATAISAEGRVRSMEHDGCKLCKYENGSMESKECIGCKQNSIDKYTRMTNADRIRSFSDDELAELLTSITDDAQSDAKSKCDYQWSEWLQSEAEE